MDNIALSNVLFVSCFSPSCVFFSRLGWGCRIESLRIHFKNNLILLYPSHIVQYLICPLVTQDEVLPWGHSPQPADLPQVVDLEVEFRKRLT